MTNTYIAQVYGGSIAYPNSIGGGMFYAIKHCPNLYFAKQKAKGRVRALRKTPGNEQLILRNLDTIEEFVERAKELAEQGSEFKSISSEMIDFSREVKKIYEPDYKNLAKVCLGIGK